MSYNPPRKLGQIKVPLLAINSADDEINPPELSIRESWCPWYSTIPPPA